MTEFQKVYLTEEEVNQSANQDISWIQKWINVHAGTNLIVDGVWGEVSQKTFLEAFSNQNAPAITKQELQEISSELGDPTTKKIRAVAEKESRGSGWLNTGRVKILWERHLMYKLMRKNRVVNDFINPVSGNYTLDVNNNDINDSWEKLAKAIGYDPLAAFQSISIGKFQVLGMHYRKCGYAHPIEMLFAATNSERVHYELLRDYILHVGKLKAEFLAIGNTRGSCTPFAIGYNGRGQAKRDYAGKLADIYRNLS